MQSLGAGHVHGQRRRARLRERGAHVGSWAARSPPTWRLREFLGSLERAPLNKGDIGIDIGIDTGIDIDIDVDIDIALDARET